MRCPTTFSSVFGTRVRESFRTEVQHIYAESIAWGLLLGTGADRYRRSLQQIGAFDAVWRMLKALHARQ